MGTHRGKGCCSTTTNVRLAERKTTPNNILFQTKTNYHRSINRCACTSQKLGSQRLEHSRQQVATVMVDWGRIAAAILRIRISTAYTSGDGKVRPPNVPLPVGVSGPSPNTRFLGPPRVHPQMASRLVQLFSHSSCSLTTDIHTQTDHATSVTIGRIAMHNDAAK